MINLLKMVIRIAWVAALVLGLLLWRGMLTGALNAHMILGQIVAAALAAIAVWALVASVRIPLAIAALVWAALTVYVGMTQTQWMPGPGHWTIEVIHLLLGAGAIGLAEALAGAITRKS